MDKNFLEKNISEIIKFSFSHSSGHGGQNVNKLNTKVQAFVPLEKLFALSESEKNLVKQKLKNIINSENCITLYAQEERTQELNKEIVVKKITQKIYNAAKIKKKRRPTKPTKASKEKRLKIKQNRSRAKSLRKKIVITEM